MLDKTQIIKDRKSGMTLQQIAEKHGTTKQYVSTITCQIGTGHFQRVTVKRCVYPNLRAWMNNHRVGVTELAGRVGISMEANNIETLRNVLRGRTQPKKNLIDKLLSLTGMTYEKMFAMEDDDATD